MWKNTFTLVLITISTLFSTQIAGQCGDLTLRAIDPSDGTVGSAVQTRTPADATDLNVCESMSYVFIAPAAGAGGSATYTWSFGSGVTTTPSSITATDRRVTVTIPSNAVSDAFTLTTVVTGSTNSADDCTSNYGFTIISVSTPSFTLPDIDVCEGETHRQTISCTSCDAPLYTYRIPGAGGSYSLTQTTNDEGDFVGNAVSATIMDSYSLTIQNNNATTPQTALIYNAASGNCLATAVGNININPKPNLGANIGTTNSEICIYDNLTATINCSDNCPTNTTGSYAWELDDGTNTFSVTGGVTATSSGSVTITPEISKGSLRYGTAGPGTYALRVTADNGLCTDTKVLSNIILNDRPAVQIDYLERTTSLDGETVCEGTEINLEAERCNDNNAFNPNNTTTGNTGNTEADGSSFNYGVSHATNVINYSDPCSSPRSDYKSLVWRAIGEDNTTGITGIPATTGSSRDYRRQEFTASMAGSSDLVNSVRYILEVTDENDCVNTDEIVINTRKNPVVTFTPAPASSSPSYTICDDTRLDLSAQITDYTGTLSLSFGVFNGTTSAQAGTFTYTAGSDNYTTSTGLLSTNATAPYYGLIDYITDSDNGLDCVSEIRYDIRVIDNPTPTINGGLSTYCQTSTMNLSCSITGADSYQWQQSTDGGSTFTDITGATADTYSEVLNTTGSDFVYKVIVQEGDCVGEATHSFVVTDAPTITFQNRSVHCEDDDLLLAPTVTGGATGNYTYNWIQNGISVSTPVINNTNGTWFSDSIPIQANFEMTLEVTDGGCTSSNSTDFEVIFCGGNQITARDSATNLTVGNVACVGDVITFSFPSGGFNSPRFEWNDGASDDFTYTIRVGDVDTIFTKLVISQASINYSWRAIQCPPDESNCYREPHNSTNNNNNNPPDGSCPGYYCWLKDSSIVFPVVREITHVLVVSKPQISMTPSTDVEVCRGDVIAASANCPGCEPDLDYFWDGSGTPITTTVDTDPAAFSYPVTSPNNTDILSVIVEDDYGCRDTVDRMITIRPLPNLAVSPFDTAFYCPSSTAILSATGEPFTTYDWSNGQDVPVITVSDTAGYYYVTATLGNCMEEDSIYLTNYTIRKPVIRDTARNVINSTYYICGSNQDSLIVEGCTACSYVWNTSATTPSIVTVGNGGYYVTQIDTNGCTSISDPILVIQSTDGMNQNSSASPSVICNGQSAILEVPPCINCSYNWYRDVTLSSVPDTIVGRNRRLYSANTNGVYYASIENEDGCVFYSTPFSVNSNSVTPPVITTNTNYICTNGMATISAPQDSTYGYQWYRNGTVISGEIASQYSATLSGNYSVDITFDNGCMVSSNILSVRDTVFKPTITPDPILGVQSICTGDSITISTTLGPGWNYQWYRNGMAIGGANRSSYSSSQAGAYYVEVETDFLCRAISDSTVMAISDLGQRTVSISSNSVCEGDSARVSVSLCPGCKYQWFEAISRVPIDTSSTTSNYQENVLQSGLYYAEVTSEDGCIVNSDSIDFTVNSVVKPAIVTLGGNAGVCNGRNAVLSTFGCIGCDYKWIKNTNPVIGGPNDSTLTVSNTNDVGFYQVEVTYPIGCKAISDSLEVTNGGFTATLDTNDYVICNGVGEMLMTTPVNNQNTYTLFRTTNPIIVNQNTPDFYVTQPGVYSVKVTDINGCEEFTNAIELVDVNIVPVLSSRATSDPTSIAASAICGVDGRVFFEASSCPGCNFQFEKVGSPNTIIKPFSADNFVLSTAGISGAGNYLVRGEYLGCEANSNLIQINYLDSIDLTTSFTDTSICNGTSITLSYDSIALANCGTCGFRWLRDTAITVGRSINGATNPNLTTIEDGYYALQITDLVNGCVDTSELIRVLEVNPPVGFDLRLDTVGAFSGNIATPLAATGNSIDLREWVFPASARAGAIVDSTTTVWFSSSPYSGALSPNAGIENDSIFNPDDSLAGFHLITYSFDTSGCVFTTSDVLEILPPPGVDVVNINPASVAYEACVSDTLVITTNNLNYPVDSVEVYNQQGAYVGVIVDSISVDTNTFGGFTVYNTTMMIRIPPEAKESSFRLSNSTGAPGDTLLTAFVLIHNQDLQITGLPNMLCSNGTPIVLTGTPSGGTFFVEDFAGAILPTVMTGDTLDPTMLTASFYVDGVQDVDVVYSFTESYTNGNLCPQLDTTIVDIEAREVFLNQIIYNEIAVSQDSELLTNLVSRVFPQRAKAIRPSFDISFSGSFTNPAGSPTHFLPNNAGVGRHALTYIIENGDCINSVEDSITVIPAPTALALPDTICSNHAPFTFGRDNGYTFQVNGPYFVDAGITSYTDTRNIMSVRSRVMDRGVGNPVIINQAIDTVTNATNLETYIYDVSQYADSVVHDTLIIQYRFLRSTDSLGVVNSLDYVIGEIHKPIFIETQNDTVQINRNVVDSIYCEQNNLRLLGGIPSTNLYGIGGYFTLEGGTGAYAMEDTLENNVLNPYLVHNIDSTIDVNYRLIYYLDGVVCRNSDTMNILIPERVNTDFFTSTGTDEFCDSDPAVLITSNIVAPDTAIWKIGGVPQSSYEFKPQPLSPGIHVVELEAIDIYGCRYTTKDTFTVHGLPDITFAPVIAGQYCTNDPAVPFTIDPSPYCPDFDSTSAQFLLNETFDSGIPATWTVYNERPGSKQWQPDAAAPYAGAGCVVVDTTQFNDTRTTLVTDTLQLIAGHNYKITFLAKVDEIDPGCSVGTCNAKMRVLMGRQNNLLFLNTVPADYPQLANDEAYVPFTVDFTPIATGPWFLGLQVYTEDWGRAIRVDELRMRDITAPACNTAGIGYMSGPGTTNILDSAYVFDPAAVSPGNHDVTYIYTNTKGCTDSVVQNITINAYPVVTMTDLDSFYCDNNPAQTLVGAPAGGQFSNLINGNLSDTLSPQFTPATYTPFYGGTDMVRYDYTDPATLCSSFIEDYVFVQQIIDTATFDIDGGGLGFCENEDSVVLTVTATSPLGETGVFYGHGVRRGNTGSGGAIFYPDSAIIDAGRTGDMELTYIFPTGSGCVDTTRKVVRVHANPDLSWMNLPDSICLNGDSIRLFVLNRVVGGPLGNTITYDTLSGRGSFTTAPANFVGLFDILAPGRGNNHPDPYAQILYEYIDVTKGTQGCSDRLEDSVRLDTVPVIRYQGVDPYYCENQDSTLVMIFPTYKAGSGFLQISEGGDTSTLGQSYYWIDPPSLVDTNLVTNQYNLYYTYEDTRGCIGEGSSSFEIRPFPRINFDTLAQDSFCQSDVLFNLMDRVPDSIDYGFFTDNLALTSITNDSMLNLAALPGPRLVTYNFTDSATVCSNNDSFMVYVFNTPDLTFQTFGGCVGSDVTFDGEMLNADPSIDSITNITWNFGDGTIVNSPLDTTRTGIPLIQYQYGASNVYNAILNVTNQGLCITSDTQKVIISPSVDLANGDYEEDFQGTNGSWQDDQPIDGINTTQVWQYVNSLEGDVIRDSLNGAWVTVGNQVYGQGMTGWLYTPCFDFTQSDRPMIKMDMWRSMLDNVDGVVLEYYRKDSADWVVVGDDNEGINWYQSNFVLARPGQQQNVTYPHGWTGESMMRSDNKAWEDPRFRLDQFCGKDDIRFRLAFASAPQTITGLGLEGVAVDNIFVGERTRNVLVEHFSNEQHKDAISQNMHYTDLSVYNQVFNSYNGLDVVLVQYQSGNAGYDINYALNTADADARVLTYGLSSENRFLLNGMRVTSSNLSSDMRQQDLDQAMLQFPKFDINIGTIVDNGGSVSVTADVTRLESLPSDSIDVHVVIIQDSLATDSQNNEKLNVMRKMLPDNGGTEFSTASFPIGVARTIAPPAWDYTTMQGRLSSPNAAAQIPGRLEAVVFVQNRRTKEVYQAATTQDVNRFINVDNVADAVGQEITDLKVYPNPAYSFFNVGFSQALEGEYNWQLIDVMGRVLQTGTAEQGIETFQVQADGLTTGTYFLIMQNEEVYVQRKVVIVR